MIDGPPRIMRHDFDLLGDLIELPLPLPIGTHIVNVRLSGLGDGQRPEPLRDGSVKDKHMKSKSPSGRYQLNAGILKGFGQNVLRWHVGDERHRV